MDDSLEVLNLSSSNLRDLIVQKLSAAREQKLTQNRSTSNLSNTSKIPPVQQIYSNQPDEEKQLLLTMLEKSQNSATQATQNCKVLEKQIKGLTEDLQKRMTENQALKSELEKLYKLNPKAKSEILILEEVKKLENLSNEKEKMYKEEIKNLNQRIKALVDNQENSKNNEKIQMEEKMSNLFEAIKEKEKEIEKLRKMVKPPVVSNNEKALSSALNELKAEKQKIERNLERTLLMSCEKEAEMSDEIIKLKTINSQFQEQRKIKENELKGQINVLSEEIIELNNALQGTNKRLNQEHSNFEAEKNELKLAYQLLQKDIKSSEAFSTFYTLKGDLQRAQETISSLESTIRHLKESSASISETQHKEKIPDIKSTLSAIQKDFQDFYHKLKTTEDLHITELYQKNSEISGLLNEISDLRHKILIFENKKYENELVIVRSDLHKAVAERSHAKRLLVSYIRSVQHLEKIVNERIDEEDLEHMYRSEVDRLNEENKSLTEAKMKQEQFFEKEIRNLEDVISGLHEKLQENESRLEGCLKLRVKENNEEMKSWIVRNKQLQELNKRIVEGFSLVDQKNKNTQVVGKKKGCNPKEALRIH